MPTHRKFNVEDLVKRLEAKQEQLIRTLRGRDLSEFELQTCGYTTPHVHLSGRDLRLCVDEFAVLLKEIRTLAKD